MTTDRISDGDDIRAELLAALKNMTSRFERCCAFAGNDEEVIKEATKSAHHAIARAEGRL
jgi:hypothetical protein